MVARPKEKDLKKNIYFVLILFVSLLTAFSSQYFSLPFTLAQSITLGIFVMAVLLWVTEAIQLYITSFLILFSEVVFLFPVLKAEESMSTATPFYSPFFSDIIALFMGGLLLARAGSKYKIDQWLSQTILRYANKRADYVLLAMMVSSAVLSMWMSNTATTAMLLIIATRMIKDFQDKKEIVSAFLLGIPFAANLGGMATPVGTPPNAIAIFEMGKAGHNISFSTWMTAALPLVVFLILFLWFLLTRWYPLKKIYIDTEAIDSSHFSFDTKTKWVVAIFILTVVLWFFSSQVGISAGMIAMLPLILFLSFQLLDKNDFRSISWDVLFLVGGGGSLSVALSYSGLGEKFISFLPISQWGLVSLIIVFMFLSATMTTFMSNTATANILIPLILTLNIEGNFIVAMVSTMIISSTMILPVSTPPNALAYSSGMIDSKQMIKIGLTVGLFAMLSILLIGIPWWHFLKII